MQFGFCIQMLSSLVEVGKASCLEDRDSKLKSNLYIWYLKMFLNRLVQWAPQLNNAASDCFLIDLPRHGNRTPVRFEH